MKQGVIIDVKDSQFLIELMKFVWFIVIPKLLYQNFPKIINQRKRVHHFRKSSILDVRHGSEYDSANHQPVW